LFFDYFSLPFAGGLPAECSPSVGRQVDQFQLGALPPPSDISRAGQPVERARLPDFC
jgi:hypothetical protein